MEWNYQRNLLTSNANISNVCEALDRIDRVYNILSILIMPFECRLFVFRAIISVPVVFQFQLYVCSVLRQLHSQFSLFQTETN